MIIEERLADLGDKASPSFLGTTLALNSKEGVGHDRAFFEVIRVIHTNKHFIPQLEMARPVEP